MGYRVFSAGQYKIRQRGKKYYVYLIEKDKDDNVRERYIGPLDMIVEIALGILEMSSTNTVGLAGFEPATTRAQAWHPSPG